MSTVNCVTVLIANGGYHIENFVACSFS